MGNVQGVQVRRGLKKDLITLPPGEFGYCTDTNELFIGSPAGNVKVATDLDVADIKQNIMAGEDGKPISLEAFLRSQNAKLTTLSKKPTKTPLALLAGITIYGGRDNSYYKDASETVVVNACVTKTGGFSVTAIAVLPEEFRPEKTTGGSCTVRTFAGSFAAGSITIAANGEILVTASTNDNVAEFIAVFQAR